MQRP
jgi:hypothetical protein